MLRVSGTKSWKGPEGGRGGWGQVEIEAEFCDLSGMQGAWEVRLSCFTSRE